MSRRESIPEDVLRVMNQLDEARESGDTAVMWACLEFLRKKNFEPTMTLEPPFRKKQESRDGQETR